MSSLLKNKKQKRHNNSRVFQKPPEPEEPTPWIKFKDELLQQESNVHKVDEFERSAFLKSRVENYNKFLILEKQNEKPIWEDFSVNEEIEDRKETNDILDKAVTSKKKKKKEKDLKRESKANTLQQDFKEENNEQTSLSTTDYNKTIHVLDKGIKFKKKKRKKYLGGESKANTPQQDFKQENNEQTSLSSADYNETNDRLDKRVKLKKKKMKEDLEIESKANTPQQDIKQKNNKQTSLSTADYNETNDVLDEGVNPKKKKKDLERESRAITPQQDFNQENNMQTNLSTTQQPQKHFNANQKNYFRRVITKATCSTKGINLLSALKDLKRCGVKRDIKKKE